MTFFNVLLDTNVFIKAKYDFHRASLDSLRKYCDNGIACLITNDIITREVFHHIKTDVGLLASQAKNSIKKHGELVNALSKSVYDSIEEALLAAPEQLSTAFALYIERAMYLPNDGISAVSLFEDYFNNVAPFEERQEKKHEFPDAAVIMSIKQYIASNEHNSLFVVTDDEGWHSSLKGIPNVYLYKELKTLLTEISKEQELLFAQIVSFVGENISSLEDRTKDWLMDQIWDDAVVENYMCIECDEVDETTVENVDLVLDAIEYIDNNEGYAVVDLSGTAKLKITFSFIDHTEEVYDREDHIWYNTNYGDGISEIEVPLHMSVSVFLPTENEDSFHLDSPDYEELDRESIEILKTDLIEKTKICEPYFNICPDCGQRIGLHNDGGNGFCVDCAPNH